MKQERKESQMVLPQDPEASISWSGETVAARISPEQLSEALDSLPHLPARYSSEEQGDYSDPRSKAFDLKRFVAAGGFGEVWEAAQASLQRLVAVKVIRKKKRDESEGNFNRSFYARHQFRVEAVTTGRLEHPNIVPVYDLGVDDQGWPLMAMKLVKGKSWSAVIANDFDELPPDEYLTKHLNVLLAVMQAVAFAHSRGIIHRDIKPSQVMLGEFGEVHLMDWGLAIGSREPLDESRRDDMIRFEGLPDPLTANSPAGTPAFMAPEQAIDHAEEVTYRTDVYLLGGTLYKILTCESPRGDHSSSDCIRMAAQGDYIPLRHAP